MIEYSWTLDLGGNVCAGEGGGTCDLVAHARSQIGLAVSYLPAFERDSTEVLTRLVFREGALSLYSSHPPARAALTESASAFTAQLPVR